MSSQDVFKAVGCEVGDNEGEASADSSTIAIVSVDKFVGALMRLLSDMTDQDVDMAVLGAVDRRKVAGADWFVDCYSRMFSVQVVLCL